MLETQGREAADQPRIRPRLDEIDRITTALGCETDADRAAFLGISPAALSKLRSGQHAPSERTIAAICAALPRLRFEQLFTITHPTPTTEEKG